MAMRKSPLVARAPHFQPGTGRPQGRTVNNQGVGQDEHPELPLSPGRIDVHRDCDRRDFVRYPSKAQLKARRCASTEPNEVIPGRRPCGANRPASGRVRVAAQAKPSMESAM